MWTGAFGQAVAGSTTELISFGLGALAVILSIFALVKATSPEFALRGSHAGLALAAVGFILYLEGTATGSSLLHSASTGLFYLGAVLFLAGPRALLPALPAGVILASSFAPSTFGVLGALYLSLLSWAVAVVSVGIFFVRRNSPLALGCFMCGFFGGLGRSYCSSCGRLLAPPRHFPRRRALGFGVFVVATIIAFGLTVPLATPAPGASLVNYGLGGPSSAGSTAPLPGWGVTPMVSSPSAPGVAGYSLARGVARVQMFVSESLYPGSALSSVNSTMTGPVPYPRVPTTLSQSMEGYTFTVKGTRYIGVQGVFAAGFLNGTVSPAFFAVNLSETAYSFERDNGSALFSAASGVVNWASGWEPWSLAAGPLQTLFQTFTQIAYAGSFSAFGVALFVIARDDELAKMRRIEALRGLGDRETLVLRTLGTASTPLLGEQLYNETRKADPTVTSLAFYSSVDELVRRDLISPSMVRRRGTNRMAWKCMV